MLGVDGGDNTQLQKIVYATHRKKKRKKRKLCKNKKERDVRLRHLVGASKPVRLAAISWSDHYSQVQA